MKKYIANYTDKTTGSSWDLVIVADSRGEALKAARAATHSLMAGCKFESVHVAKN